MHAALKNTFDVATSSDGTIFIVDRASNSLRIVSPCGTLMTLIDMAGNGFADGPLATAKLSGGLTLLCDVVHYPSTYI